MYALFSQQKLVYQGLLGAAQTELMDITHKHENLALRDSGLKAKLSFIQEDIASRKADLYEQLTNSLSTKDMDIITSADDETKTGHFKGYDADGTKDFYTQREWILKTHGFNPDDYTDASAVEDLLAKKGILTRDAIDQEIQELDAELATEEAQLNRQIDETARKETRLDTEKASIETKITDYQKQLEKIEEAEGKGIEASIGKFQGVG